MLAQLASELMALVHASQANLPIALACLAVLWVVHLANILTGKRLMIFGIWPRQIAGLPGIVLSPLVHASFEHLFLNSIPLLVLADLLLISGHHAFAMVTISVTVISGILVWLLGRRAIHLGASGLIMGYWSFLLVQAYTQPTIMAVILAVLCLYYLGGLALNLFVFDKGSSWEGHIFGFIGGVLTALWLSYV
jgi:membrane associated rhomboid family serine protease